MKNYKLSQIFKIFDPEHSKRCFLEGKSISYTYGDLAKSINLLSKKLELDGVESVLLIAKDKAHFITAIFACLVSGVKPIICSPKMALEYGKVFSPEYFDTILTDVKVSETSVYKAKKITIAAHKRDVTNSEKAEIENLKNTLIPANTIFVYLFTSGSTGTHKLVEKTLENIIIEVEYLANFIEASEKDFFLSVVPFYHMYGFLFSLILPCYAAARTNLNIPYSPGSILSYLDREYPTIFIGIPAHYISLSRIVEEKKMVIGTKLAISSTDHLPEKIQKQIESSLGWNILEIYGSTETGGIAYRKSPDKTWTPFKHVTLKFSKDVLEVKSQAVSKSYIDNDGFFETFDIVSPSIDNSMFRLIGRARQLIKIAGNRVFAPEVEETIKCYQNILDAVVLGIEVGSIRNVEIIAFVCLRDEKRFPKVEFYRYLKKNLSMYQIPKKIIYVDTIPKNINNKIAYTELEKIAKSKSSVN